MRKRKRTSIVWNIPKDELEEIVKNNNSLSGILRCFKLANKGGNYSTLKRRLNEEQIDYSHIPLGVGSNRGKCFTRKKISLEEIMVENSTYSRSHLKRRLLKKGILENKCEICGLDEIWNDQKLVMVLDHTNGVSNDNRRENLRMLCPNCNSQQKTFAGRNNKKIKKEKYYCPDCGKEKYKYSKRCFLCSKKINSFNRRKVKDRPSEEQLLKEVEETSYCAVGRKYGVSDSAIRKWLKIKK